MNKWRTILTTNSNNKEEDADGQLTSSAELQDVFHRVFPQQQQQDQIVYAFGYGSGVFVQQQQQQHNNDDKEDGADDDPQPTTNAPTHSTNNKMLDMILVVRDSLHFHTLNQQVNPHHYAPLFRHTNPSFATWWQQHPLSTRFLRNPKVFFNFVETPVWLKYGVIEERDLAADLQYWDSLYIAGRLHKPTAVIPTTTTATTSIPTLQQHNNLPAALSMALLLLANTNTNTNANTTNDTTTPTLSLEAVYSQISALSYTGDFRMQVGAEDPHKVRTLVQSPGQLGRFHQLYWEPAWKPLIEAGVLSLNANDNHHHTPTDAATIQWDPTDASAIRHLWGRLPPRFRQLPYYRQHHCLHNHHSTSSSSISISSISTTNINSSHRQEAQSELQTEMHQIVAPAARYQSFKGLWTAGMAKSARYALAKLSKGILRKA